MSEHIPTNEIAAEKFPTEREILNQLAEIIEGEYEVIRTLADKKGVWVAEAD